ncbi:MAG: pilus assembly protein [bacterium]|nr:pilus assembly protein [bacterium]
MRGEKGSALIESVIAVPIIITAMMVMIQFSLLVVVQLTANYAAYRAGRAIYVSSNRSSKGYNGSDSSQHSARSDAVSAVRTVMIPLLAQQWIWMYSTHLYFNQGGKVGEEEIQDNQTLLPDRDIWVKVTVKAKIAVPLTKYVFSDGAPFVPLPWKTIHTYYLVHTPSRGKVQ